MTVPVNVAVQILKIIVVCVMLMIPMIAFRIVREIGAAQHMMIVLENVHLHQQL